MAYKSLNPLCQYRQRQSLEGARNQMKIFKSTLPIQAETLMQQALLLLLIFKSTLPIQAETFAAADISLLACVFKSTLPIQAETAKSSKNFFSGNYYSINLLHSDTYFSFQRHSFFLFLSQFTSFSGANPPAVLCLHHFRTKKSVYLSHQTQVLSQYALFYFYNYLLNYKIGDCLFPYR